jgi:hypothetical protein
VKELAKESKATLTSDPALKEATKELRTLLERFANEKSIDMIIDARNALVEDGRKEEELMDWFRKVDVYARKVRFLSLILCWSLSWS